jgi:hypothetical protein
MASRCEPETNWYCVNGNWCACGGLGCCHCLPPDQGGCQLCPQSDIGAACADCCPLGYEYDVPSSDGTPCCRPADAGSDGAFTDGDSASPEANLSDTSANDALSDGSNAE